jgi:hypothetical protein
MTTIGPNLQQASAGSIEQTDIDSYFPRACSFHWLASSKTTRKVITPARLLFFFVI